MRVHTRWSETIGRQRRHRRRRSLNNRRPRSLRGPIRVVDTSAVIAREKEHARSAESLNCGNKRRCHLSPRCDSAFRGIPRPIPDHRDHRESREPACVSFSSSFSPSLRKSAGSTSERAVSPISPGSSLARKGCDSSPARPPFARKKVRVDRYDSRLGRADLSRNPKLTPG